MPDVDRYLRIASRTGAENRTLAEAMATIIEAPPQTANVDA